MPAKKFSPISLKAKPSTKVRIPAPANICEVKFLKPNKFSTMIIIIVLIRILVICAIKSADRVLVNRGLIFFRIKFFNPAAIKKPIVKITNAVKIVGSLSAKLW